jgi:hypothetical protein
MTNEVEIVVVTRQADAGFSRIRKGFDDVAKGAATSGVKAGSGFADGISGAVGKDPRIAAALVAAGATAAPFLGAAISGAVIGGAGIGGVLGGVMLVKDDARVKAAGTTLAENLLGSLRGSAGSFVQPTLRAIDMVGDRAELLEPKFDRIFGASSRYLEPLTEGLLDAAEAVIGGLTPAIEGAEPVIKEIAEGAAELGDAIGDVFSDMSDDGPAAAEALGLAFEVVEGVLRATGKTIDFLTGQYRALSYGIHMLAGDSEGANALFETSSSSADNLSGSLEKTAEAAEKLREKMDEVNDELYDSSSTARSSEEAQIRLRKSINDTRDAIDGTIAVTDDESLALIDLAEDTDRATQAMVDNGASQEEVQAVLLNSRKSFIEAAEAMGHSREEAVALANELMSFPVAPSVGIRVDASQAFRAANEVRWALSSIPDETVNIVTRLTGATGSRAAADYAKQYQATGGPSRAAGGGPRGNMTLVGEEGPEFVSLPFGSAVSPAANTRQMMASMGGGGAPTVIEARYVGGGDTLIDAIMSGIQFKVRTEGGGDVNYLAGA